MQGQKRRRNANQKSTKFQVSRKITEFYLSALLVDCGLSGLSNSGLSDFRLLIVSESSVGDKLANHKNNDVFVALNTFGNVGHWLTELVVFCRFR